MSTTLLVRHLCSDLDVSEREDFLKHFGAQKVWFINPKSHTAFASFATKSDAENALWRLHQLELLGKRLTVEYANNSHPTECPKTTENNVTNDRESLKKIVDSLCAWNPSVNLLQPPPPSLSYKYPSCSPHILFNIIYEIGRNVKLYVQLLHLMNKMGLDPPFENINQSVKDYVLNCLKSVDIKTAEMPIPVPQEPLHQLPESYSEESEISSGEDVGHFPQVNAILPMKRKSNLKRINKKPKISILPLTAPHEGKKTVHYATKEVFEENALQETKKIEVKVNKVLAVDYPENSFQVTGTIGKMLPSKNSNDISEAPNEHISKELKIITMEELSSNRISSKDLKSLPVFKDYHPGTPSMRLYIKNLSKEVTSDDIERIYKRYTAECDFQEAQSFDVRVMQEGRMKGQAFVTLPTVKLSEKALGETNGFILKNKPMVVQFARTAK